MALVVVRNGEKKGEMTLGDIMQQVRLMAFEPFSPETPKKLTIAYVPDAVPVGAKSKE